MWRQISSIWQVVKTKFKHDGAHHGRGSMVLYKSASAPVFGKHLLAKAQKKISLAEFRGVYLPEQTVSVGTRCIDVEKKKIGEVSFLCSFFFVVADCTRC